MDLARLGRKCFVSQNALGEILTWAKQNPDTLAELGTSRASIKRAREDACDIVTSYGKLLQEMSLRGKNGNEIKVAYLAPAAMLQHAASSCEKFGQCLGKVLEGRLSSVERPYTIVIYSDEVSPGNQLKHTNRRKLQVLYWSLQELGPLRLSSESSWFVLTVLRTETVNNISGGMSQVARECVKAFYREAADFSAGIVISVPGPKHFVMVGRVGYILGDEAALKHFWENKGASGKLCCLFCQNVVQRRYAPECMDGLAYHDELDSRKFRLHTDASVFAFAMHLQARAPELNKEELSKLETNTGFNHVQEGVLLDPLLQRKILPISATCYDPMHVFLVAGVFHLEVTLLLDSLAKKIKVKQSDIDQFFSDCVWPAYLRARGTSGQALFAKKHEDSFKSSASEGLAVFPVLRLFLQMLEPAQAACVHKELVSFFALCSVLDALRLAGAGTLAASELLEKIMAHLRAFQAPRMNLHTM